MTRTGIPERRGLRTVRTGPKISVVMLIDFGFFVTITVGSKKKPLESSPDPWSVSS